MRRMVCGTDDRAGRTGPGRDGGFVDHAFIGENGRPLLKIQDFDAKMRSGTGRAGRRGDDEVLLRRHHGATRTSAPLFASYSKTMAALQRDFPKVAFIHVTVPLTTEPGPAVQAEEPAHREQRVPRLTTRPANG